MTSHNVQILKEWPPIKGKAHPIRNGNTIPIRKPNSLSVFWGILFFITNPIQILVSKFHLYLCWIVLSYKGIYPGILIYPLLFS